MPDRGARRPVEQDQVEGWARPWALAVGALLFATPIIAHSADVGEIAVLQHDGSPYQRYVGGQPNEAPRQAAARAFFSTHRDAYDFLIVFPTFPYDLSDAATGGETLGLHSFVRNDVTGIGQPLADVGASYGSAARLKSYIDINSLVPGVGASFDSSLGAIAHEIAHHWSGRVSFIDPATGAPSLDLLGQDQAHWSFFLDSNASVLYGSHWQPLGTGSFTALESMRRYSALDLYLMGLLAPSEVAPFALIRPAAGAAHAATNLPPPDGTVVQGTAQTVTIDQLIQAMGPRNPPASGAQGTFRAAFALLVGQGQQATPDQIAFVESLRREWANRFFFMTQGRAVMETDLVEVPPRPVASSPSVRLGLDFLLAAQRGDGSWSDAAFTTVRETESALEALSLFTSDARALPATARGATYLAQLALIDNDTRARRVLGLVAGHGSTSRADVTGLANMNADGGFGLSGGYTSSVIDTVLVGLAWQAQQRSDDVEALVSNLLSAQNGNGGWPVLRGGPSGIEATGWVLRLLAGVRRTAFVQTAADAAFAFLQSHHQPDGSYADPLTLEDGTASALQALDAWDALGGDSASSIQALLARQIADGSWDQSVYATAEALKALRRLLAPNLSIGALTLSSAQVIDGEPVKVTVQVLNGGRGGAAATTVRAFDSNGVPFGPPQAVPPLAPGATQQLILQLDTTGHAGSQQLFVIVDAEGAVDETREDDNRLAAALRVIPSPDGSELFVAAGSVATTPPAVDRLPATLQVSALVGNLGLADASQVEVAVYVRDQLANTSRADMPAGSRFQLQVSAAVPPGPGPIPVRVVIDPNHLVQETRRDNNSDTTLVPVVSSVDLVVANLTVAPSQVQQGDALTIQYTLGNIGTIDATGATVQVRIVDSQGRLAASQIETLTIASGAVLQRSMTWRAAVAGTLQIGVQATHHAERDPSNNAAETIATVSASTLPNLAVRPSDITIAPAPVLEGKTATLTVTVRNTGGAAAAPFDVDFWLGDPASGGQLLGTQSVSGLEVGAAQTLAQTYTVVGSKPVPVVVRADPRNVIAEFDEADNVAVVTPDVLPLPDLVLADVTPENPFPRLGDTVPVSVKVINSGGQQSDATAVALYLGAPEEGGKRLAVASVPALAAGASADAAFTWNALATGAQKLVAIVNESCAITEGRYDNDRGERAVMVQDGKLALSNPYFSPNGDGVKDTTEAFYRLAAPSAVVLEVRDGGGRLVRTISPDSVAGNGSLTWDGRDSSGRVAKDGKYGLSVRTTGTEPFTVLGTLTAVVDNNRSPLESAIGTGLLHVQDLDTYLPPYVGGIRDEQFAPMSDDSGVVQFVCPVGADGNEHCYFEFEPISGDQPTPLTPVDHAIQRIRQVVVSPDNSALAYLEERWFSGWDCTYDLVLFSIRSGTFTTLTSGPIGWGHPLVFSPDGKQLLYFIDSWYRPFELRIANVDGSDDRTLVPGPVVEYAFSPDGNWISFVLWDGSIGVMSPDGGERRTVVSPNTLPLYMFGRRWRRHAWLPDGRIAFVAAESGIGVVDPTTGELGSIYQAPEADRHQFDEDIQIAASSQGDAIAFTYTPGAYWGSDQRQILVSAPVGSPPRVLYQSPGDYSNLSEMDWSPQGTFIYAWETRPWYDASHIALTTLANLTAQMSVTRRPHSSVLTFSGTACDVNFERYEIGVRPAGTTGLYQVIARSSEIAIGATLAEWVPPSPGVYEGVLTVSDLAGNVRQQRKRFAWSDTEPIANVTRQPEYISPNGDGVQDAAMIHYSVTSPVSAEFQVLTAAGNVVRRMPRTHLEAGDYAVDWDGRDDQGLVVPDGEYFLVAGVARLRIVVDTQPPVVDFALLDNLPPLGTQENALVPTMGIQRASDCSPPGIGIPEGSLDCSGICPPPAPQAYVNFASRATDQNLQSWSIQSHSEIVVQGQTQSAALWSSPAYIARFGDYQLVARDLAGNTTVTPVITPTERVWIIGVGERAAVSECETGFLDLGYPIRYRKAHRLDMLEAVHSLNDAPELVGLAPRSMDDIRGEGIVGIGIDTSIRTRLTSYEVLYRPRDTSIAYQRGPAEGRLDDAVWWSPPASILNPFTKGLLDLEIRLQATDVSGRQFTSQAVVIGSQEKTPGGYVGMECSPGDWTDALELNLKAGLAINAQASTVSATPLDDLGTPAVFPGGMVLSEDGSHLWIPRELLPGCKYKIDLNLQLQDGTKRSNSLQTDLCSLYVAKATLEGQVATVVVGEDVTLPLESLDVYVGDPQRPTSWTFAAHVGAFEKISPALRIDIGDWPRCSQLPLRFVAHLAGGRTVDSASIGMHADNSMSCLAPRSAPAIDVPCLDLVVGRASRQAVAPLCATVRPTYGIAIDAKSSGTIVDLKANLLTLSGAPIMPLSVDAFTPGSKVSTLATVDTAPLAPGDYIIAAEVRDDLGFVARGRTQFPLAVDRVLPVVRVDSPASNETVNPVAIQNADGTTSRFVDVRGLVSDDHLEGYWIQLREASGDWTTAFEKQLTAPAALAVSGTLGRIDVASLPAGDYGLRVVAGDVSGSSTCSPEIPFHIDPALPPEIDTTPPIARIDSPRNTFLVSGAGFVGTAFDANLASYHLEISDGAPGTAFRFVEVATGARSIEHGTLAELAGLPADGVYTARLRVLDRAGNESVDVAAFIVDTTPPRPPPALQVVLRKPSDGLLTWTSSPDPDVVGYRVLRACGNGQPALLTADLVRATSYTDPSLADGEYRYTVVAVDAAGLQSAPSREARLVVDTTPPMASVTRPPAGAGVSGALEVIGTAFSRDDFREYRLLRGDGTAPTTFVLIRRSPAAVVAGTLGFVDTTVLPQGSVQTLRLEAEDLSGNIGEARVTFVVDNAPPAPPVLLSAAAQGSNVALTWRPNSEPDLAGYLVYRNGVPLVPPGTSLDDLRRALLPVVVTSQVDTAVPDGTYTYQVQAVDTAGNASALSNAIDVVLETGAPKARIGAPAHLARINGPVTVVAESDALDVASVQVEVRAAGAASFSPLGAPGNRVPFQVQLDPTLFPSPIIEVRAVARDRSGNVDPAPVPTFLFYDPPLTVPAVQTLTVEATTTVSWSDADSPARLAAFGVQRPSAVLDLAPYPTPPAGHASATSTTNGSPDNAYDGLSWTYWRTATLPAEWTLTLDTPTLVDSVDVSLVFDAKFDLSARVSGTWVPIVRGARSTNSHATVSTVGPLQVSGIRLTVTEAPYGVALVDVTLSPLRVVAGPPVSDTFYGIAEQALDYQVAAYSIFGQRRAGSGQAPIYVPVISTPPGAVGNDTLTLTGSRAAPNATIRIYADGGTTAGEGLADGTGAFAVDVPLARGTNIFAAQSLYGAGNRSFRSSPVSVRYDPPPDLAIQLALVAVRGSDVELAFTVTGDLSSVAQFDVGRSDGTQPRSVARLAPDQRALIDSGVPNGTYAYTVVPLNGDGFPGSPSNEVTASVQVTPPSAPATLQVTVSPEGGTLDLQWSYAGSPSDRFLVERASTGGAFVTITRWPVQGTTYRDRGLTNGIAYAYRIRAVDPAGNAGDYSNVATGTPRDVTAPAPPVITAPTIAGAPVTVTVPDSSVAGRAEYGALVELLQNGRYAGTGRADAVAVDPVAYAFSRPFAQGFDMSRDGQLVAYGYLDAQSHVGIVVEDRSGAPVANLALAGLDLDEGPYLSPDATRIVFTASVSPSYASEIFLGDLQTGVVEPLLESVSGRDQSPAWSPDGQRLAYASYRNGYCLVVTDLATRTEHVVPISASIGTLAWSGGHSVLALLRGWPQSIVEFNTDSGITRTLLEASIDAQWAVAAPRRTAAVAANIDNLGWVLNLLDLNSGTYRSVPFGESAGSPAFSPDGSRLAFLDQNGELRIHDLGSGSSYPAGFQAWSGSLSWPAPETLTLVDWRAVQRLSVVGRFAIPVVLDPARNVFFATAIDASGNRSMSSEPIEVTLDPTRAPDLALTAKMQPPIPVVGQPATAVLEIRNVGTGDAGPARLSVGIVTNGGSIRQAVAQSVPALAAGATATVLVPLDLSGLMGKQQLIAVVDPAHEIPDPERSNNEAVLEFIVAQTPALALAVSVNPSSVQADGTAVAHVTLANPGVFRNVVVRVSVADSSGAVALSTPSMSFSPLGSGAVAEFDRDLPVGRILAGNYQVIAEAVSDDAVVARASVPITIELERSVDLSLVSERASYLTGEAVTLEGTVTNRSRNAYLQGATYRLELLDATGAIAYAAPPQALPLLWTGGSSVQETLVSSEAVVSGTYQARATVELEGTVLAQRTIPVVVLVRPLLSGTLSVVGSAKSPPVAPAGSGAQLGFTIRNDGTANVLGIAARVVVVDPDTLAVVSSQALPVTALAANAQYSGTYTVSTVGLPLKVYAASLVADHDGLTSDVLATVRFRVADPSPPVLALENQTSGMFARGTVAPVVHATDDYSGTVLVQVSVDGQPPVRLALVSGVALDGIWSGSLPLGADGAHALVFSAADVEGNNGLVTPTPANPIAVQIISDTVPPVVAISGVTEGTCYPAPAVPLATASDLNLAAVDTRLNGAPFASATPVTADGDYSFSVQATDKAGNQAASLVHFVVEQTPPRLYMSGAPEGAYVSSDVQYAVTGVSAHLVSLQVAVNGVPSAPTATLSAEGPYAMTAHATDCAGKASDAALHFTIDKTPPAVTISGVVDGAYYRTDVLPSWTASDANLGSVVGTLNGVAFSNGSAVSADGNYLLDVVALDRAGNRTEVTRAFVVDKTPPVVILSGFVDGSYVNTHVAPGYTASDVNLDHVEAMLDGLPFVQGMVAGVEGFHAFTVKAYDKAGNNTERSGSFTIDKTPPTVTLLGFVDGSFVKTAVSPSYSVSDANLDTVQATLNGQAFQAGTVVPADGSYRFHVVALDKAGNRTEQAGSFTIDQTAPSITVTGVTDGHLTNQNVTPVVTITDANLASSSTSLDGQPFTSGTAVSAEGDHRLVAQVTDKAGNTASANVGFTIDKTPPSITISGVSDGAQYDSQVVPVVTITDAHLTKTVVTLNGAPFTSGTTVNQDGSYQLYARGEDGAGNVAEKMLSFTIQATNHRVEKRVAGPFARTLALVGGGGCCSGSIEVLRAQAFLQSYLGGNGRLLFMTTDDEAFLSEMRSGLYNVMVLVGLHCSGFGPWPDSGIALELTELVYVGKAGAVVIRSRPPNLPGLRELLGADLEGTTQATTVRFSDAPLTPLADLTLEGDAMTLKLYSASPVASYASSQMAAAKQELALGRSLFFGFDVTQASQEANAGVALQRAVDWVAPADTMSPLAVAGVELALPDGGFATGTWIHESLEVPLVALAGVPPATINSARTSLDWTFVAHDPTKLLRYYARLPDQVGSYTTTTEISAIQPSGTQLLGSFEFELAVAETGEGLLQDARTAVARLPSSGHDNYIRLQIEADLVRVESRVIRSRIDIEANLQDLFAALSANSGLKTVSSEATRLALDELIRYWEARWYVY